MTSIPETRFIVCQYCGGQGFLVHERFLPHGHDEYWEVKCAACNGVGDEEVPVYPIEDETYFWEATNDHRS